MSPLERRALFLATVAENRWIPHTPHARQIDFLLLSDVEEVLFGGAARGGKGLRLSTPIPTPYGFTDIGALEVGDEVFGGDGSPCRVTFASEVQYRDTFEVVFDDGTVIVADDVHRWKTFTHNERMAALRLTEEWRARRRKSRPARNSGTKSEAFRTMLIAKNKSKVHEVLSPPSGEVRSTWEIAETLRIRNGKRVNHSIPIAGALQLPEASLPIHPYVLGVWLGDGNSANGAFYGCDREIADEITAIGYRLSESRDGERTIRWNILGLAKTLRKLGFRKNKHIPFYYLRASYAQRLALLQGLMDTDGYCGKNGKVEFTNTNRRLAEGVFELACTLGVKPTINEGRATLKGRDCGPKWRVMWTSTLNVFRLSRKSERIKTTLRGESRSRYIVEVRQIPSEPTKCIAVNSPDHTFLVGKEMVPTHNTDALLMAALQFVDVPTYGALLLQKTTTDMKLTDAMQTRCQEWMQGTGARWIHDQNTFLFPSGARISFGYLQHVNDHLRYKGSSFHFIGFDELTRFDKEQYLYLFSRMSRAPDCPIPMRMRAATNPGDRGHGWVKKHFLSEAGKAAGRVFVPSKVADNPSVDRIAYLKSLSNLDNRTRKQLEEGDWSDFTGLHWKPGAWPCYVDVGDAVSIPQTRGKAFDREIFLWRNIPVFVGVDWATSEDETRNCTAFVAGGLLEDFRLLILDVFVGHVKLDQCPQKLSDFCRKWHPQGVVGEDDTLSKSMLINCRRMPFIPEIQMLPIGNKAKSVRWTSGIVMGENKRVLLPAPDDSGDEPEWLGPFKDQLEAVTGDKDKEDDIADAFGVLCRKIDSMRPVVVDNEEEQFPEVFAPGKQIW
jgi:hypothetical protein